ncbi:hypothetical protein JR316_0012638 [Psilocybe cubensis]|uniref:Uncharacterized protein n=2 Tax=Psilocybe cubensis TaxID=181762 RepID=A0ACB8GIS3_PSICU|nr:hypothetical protein JR316_0012638 [Psilocybe cubensis]KAH9475523.1 hypothetical protein JR316_0012638 [Psilocybe cubensis]
MSQLTSQNNKSYSAFLPDDILRQVFETAAQLDFRVTVNLASLSRRIRPWIDEILYSVVILRTLRTSYAFLRTIQTPNTKPRDFFAKCVKSLLIYADIDTDSLVTLLSICRGVINLSYWPSTGNAYAALPGYNPSSRLLGTPTPWNSHVHSTATPNISSSPLSTRQATKIYVPAVTEYFFFDLHSTSHIAPRRLSVMLHDSHPLFIFRPRFEGSPFFGDVTHLSVLNRWEEWTAWAGHRMTAEALPRLTHLKFDLSVGQAPESVRPRSLSPSCSRWLETVTVADPFCPSPPESESESHSHAYAYSERKMSSSECAWASKIACVANALSDVLSRHPSLIACVLVLRFDSNPARTARLISNAVASRMASSKQRRSSSPRYSMDMQCDSDDMDVDMDSDSPPAVDPRLVFAWEKESFRYNYAHSEHEQIMWKSAESIAKAQRFMKGENPLR